VFGYRKAVIFAEFGNIAVDDFVARDVGRCFIYRGIVLEILVIVGHIANIGVFLEHRGIVDGVFENIADIMLIFLAVVIEREQRGEFRVGDNLRPFLVFVLFEQVRGVMQVRKLLLEVRRPYFFGDVVCFFAHCGVVQIALAVFVHEQTLEPSGGRIHKRFVLRYVLFFDHADFEEQLASYVGRGIERAEIHIEVHRLLFRRRDYHGVQFRREQCVGRYGATNVVERVTVLGDRRSAGHDLGIAADEAFARDALFHFEKIAEAVQVVEIFEEREVERGFYIFVLFGLGEYRGEIHCELLVRDGCFERGFVFGLKEGNAFLLLLFESAQESDVATQVVVVGVAGELVHEPGFLEFRTVKQNRAHFGVRVCIVFVVRGGIKFLPIADALVDFAGFLVKRIHYASDRLANIFILIIVLSRASLGKEYGQHAQDLINLYETVAFFASMG